MTAYAKQLNALHHAMVHHQPEPLLPLMKEECAQSLSKRERINIYTQGYIQRLTDAVRMDYPALCHYLGTEKCNNALHAFVQATPSTQWDLNRYPVQFGTFVAKTNADEAATSLAALEGAITDCFWQPECAALDPATLATCSEETFGQLCFTISPLARLLTLTHDANHYLTAFRSGSPLPTIQARANHVLVIRSGYEVERIPLEPMEHEMLQHLASGKCFEQALEAMDDPQALAQSLPEYIARWMRYGLFTHAQ